MLKAKNKNQKAQSDVNAQNCPQNQQVPVSLYFGKISCKLPHAVWSPHFKESSNNRLKAVPKATWLKHCEKSPPSQPEELWNRLTEKVVEVLVWRGFENELDLPQPAKAPADCALGKKNGSGNSHRSCPVSKVLDHRNQGWTGSLGFTSPILGPQAASPNTTVVLGGFFFTILHVNFWVYWCHSQHWAEVLQRTVPTNS